MNFTVRSYTAESALKGLEEIFKQLQTDFHDRWDWQHAYFFVDVVRATFAELAEVRDTHINPTTSWPCGKTINTDTRCEYCKELDKVLGRWQ